MREYNPTIQYANKEDHPTMAMNNILACPWQPILGNEEPSVKTCFLAKLLEVLLQILHFPKNGLSGAIRIALFSLWEELEAKLLRPGQLLGYAWNLWYITLQMGYVENFTCYLNPFTWIKTSNFLTYMSCLTEQKYMYFFVMIMFLIF